jgi:hypothetical protein
MISRALFMTAYLFRCFWHDQGADKVGQYTHAIGKDKNGNNDAHDGWVDVEILCKTAAYTAKLLIFRQVQFLFSRPFLIASFIL